jgi:polyhydroxyalkanoate synthesis regulator phasin
MDLCKGNYPTTKELNKLGTGESQIYDALLHTAGLHKRVEHTANKSVDALKNRLTLIEGEITAGNTNKQLYQELRDIVFKLHHLGEITQNSATAYLKQMK